MADSNIAVLTEAKTEYTKQLINILCTNIHQGIKSIYTDAKLICEQKKAADDILIVFQELLSRIPKWSQEIIDKEYSRIEENSQCDWLEDLITAVFISHTKVLTLAHQGKQNKKINIKVPKPSHFMHLCYIEAARGIWRDPYLFSERVPQYQIQKNMRESETIISDAINETIRKLLPVKNILKEYLGDGYNSEVSEEEDIKVQTSSKHKRNLKKLVKKELEKTLGGGAASGDDDDDADSNASDDDDESETDGTTTDATTDDSDDDDPISRKKLIKKLIKKEIRKSANKTNATAAAEPIASSSINDDISASQSEISDIELDSIDISSIPIQPVDISNELEIESEPEPEPPTPALVPEPVAVAAPVIAAVATAAAAAVVEPIIESNYKDVTNEVENANDNDVKEINIGTKVISGLKDFLGFGESSSGTTKIVKLDESGNNSDNSHQRAKSPPPVIDVVPVAPTPIATPVVPVAAPAAAPSAPAPSASNLNIQSIDDFDFDIDAGTEEPSNGSDLELDCSDVDLETVAASNNNSKSQKQFSFF